MKHSFITVIMCFAACCEVIQASAAEVTVFGTGGSTAPLVVETVPSDPLEYPFKWSFNAPQGGWTKRTVLRVEAQTNAVFAAFLDMDGNGEYTLGEPFGVSSGRNNRSIDLSETSSVTPRVNLWDGSVDSSNDRVKVFGHDQVVDTYTGGSNRFTEVSAPAKKSRVRVVRYKVDKFPVYRVGVDAGVVLDKTFDQGVRSYLHEGDFLADGKFDIDWDNFYDGVVNRSGVREAACEVTNVTYLIVYNWDADSYRSDADTTTVVKASSTLVTRRFEKRRTVPTALSATTNETHTTFSFRIDGEDKLASLFGTTYTSFKVKAMTINGATTNDVWDSGTVRLPAADEKGVYRYSVPRSAFTVSDSLFYRIAVYNAKFKTDAYMGWKQTGDPFSLPVGFTSELPDEESSGVVEVKVHLGRFLRVAADLFVIDAENLETKGLLKAVDSMSNSHSANESRTFRFKTSDTNAVFAAFLDMDGNGEYTLGEPFGVSSGRNNRSIDLSETSSVTPRVNLWDGSVDSSNDRVKVFGHDQVVDTYTGGSNRFTEVSAPAKKSRVRVVRYKVDKFPVYRVGVDAGVVLDKTFDQGVRSYLHEGDLLADGKLDIDWDNLYDYVVDWRGVQMAGCEVTNVTYLIVYNWDADSYLSDSDTTTVVKASSTLVTRRFEKLRTVPTALSATTNATRTTFSFRIDGEDKLASLFGTTYTSFKVKAMTINGATTNDVWNSGIVRLPASDANGVYRYSVPRSAFTVSDSLFYRVAVYNAKFKTDAYMGWKQTGDPFSTPQPIQ